MIRLLLGLFNDPEPLVRTMAVWALSQLREKGAHEDVVVELIRLLEDKFWKVRIASVIAIGALG